MNTEKICRCCLALDAPLLSIYDGGSAGKGCVADMLKQIAKLVPQLGDNMPEKACLQCISEINRCFVFKMKCENSDRTLRQLLPNAVPEPLDYVPKKPIVTSSAVQTDDNILISSMVLTVPVEKPLQSHSSVQTGPLLSHKEIQTEYEITPTNAYILCDDSNADSNCSVVEEIFIPTSEQQPKNTECNRIEYYEGDVEETQDGQQNQIYQDTEYIYNENLKTDNEYEIDSSEGTTPQESDETVKPQKSSICTRSSSKPKGQYKCSQCIMTFISLKVLKRHLANRHGIKNADLIIDYVPAAEPVEPIMSVEEPSSSDNTAKQNNMNVELTADNVAKPQLLPREKVTSSVNEELLLTNIKYFCDYCQAGFAQRKSLTYHMKNQVCMISNFKCNECKRNFVSEENLEAHKRTHENPHKCLECATVCKTMEELSQHMISNHNRNARNQCHVCKKVFTMKNSLIDHLRVHSGEKPFLCTICGKSFSQNSNLRQHLTRHNNEKNFKCDMCPSAYVTKSELFSHKRTHTGDHPFKCEICPAQFSSPSSLRKHMRKHTGERPYACEFCPMHFATLCVLKNHRRIHTGEKPFKCRYCTKSFTQTGDCRMHERTHINKAFQCFCETKFSKKSNFRHHIKTQHPDFNKKEIQALLDKSVVDNDNTEYHITLMEMEDTDGKFVNSPSGGDTENEADDYVTISHDAKNNLAAASNSSNSNEELLEIVMEDVG
ncbi:zinc finger protein ZFP2 [Calliphora vicina]|uniref:zinc finger protein ZFP2 n=1 Tax=Calliphora vicina TaxID=7373 RepID=UPI00325BB5FD